MAAITIAFLCLALVSVSFAQENLTCDLKKPCKNLPTRNITLKEFASKSPLYEPIFIYQDSFKNHLTSCVTFFPVNDFTFLVFRVVTRTDGSTELQVFLNSDLNVKDLPGVFRQQGLFMETGNSSTVHNIYLVDTLCDSCSQIYVAYACFFLDSEEYVYPVDDFVYGVSGSMTPPTSCLDHFEEVVDQLGFSHSAGFIRASNSCRPYCVTKFNDNYCINADRVDPAYALAYP